MTVPQRLVHPEHCSLNFIDRKISNIEKFVLKCDWIEEGDSWSFRNV